ncbi:MAG: flagellar basal-body rod protein FlgF [Candidatus Andeanibacterium colombiense]|uniref:Flagellar basal-body rod protein FlgF n=1 Tax=Candidatus Andeanibacterium colombiense TaxID=3121345 RepID=A0AAJ6BML0_9SPHN|nr:MAG: flagellar basal-body rod protein FlgF [Sphingomonadaceae bacterium]
MFGSIYIGLSGLTAYSEGLKAVSNNVSNLNTSGFKASDVTFSDVYGAGSSGGLSYSVSSPSGHGVTLDQISTNFQQGELRQTDRDLDLAIDGNGFFVLLDEGQTYYTRTGSFAIDDDGYLVLSGTDHRLAILDDSGRPASVNVDDELSSPPEETTKIKFAQNLSSTATEFTIPDVKVYDERGEAHLWTLKFSREETVFDEWTLKVTDDKGVEIGTKTLKFAAGAVDPLTETLNFADSASGLSVAFDFSGVTSNSEGTVSSLRAADVDGRATGSISSLAVNEKGQLEITYSNAEKKSLGSIALADFRDAQKLQQRSGGLFADNGFAQVQYLSAEDTRVGTILSKRLEASNVDLGSQFAELILIQRGFQASSQIISVSNDMIQQLFGIRGQG